MKKINLRLVIVFCVCYILLYFLFYFSDFYKDKVIYNTQLSKTITQDFSEILNYYDIKELVFKNVKKEERNFLLLCHSSNACLYNEKDINNNFLKSTKSLSGYDKLDNKINSHLNNSIITNNNDYWLIKIPEKIKKFKYKDIEYKIRTSMCFALDNIEKNINNNFGEGWNKNKDFEKIDQKMKEACKGILWNKNEFIIEQKLNKEITNYISTLYKGFFNYFNVNQIVIKIDRISNFNKDTFEEYSENSMVSFYDSFEDYNMVINNKKSNLIDFIKIIGVKNDNSWVFSVIQKNTDIGFYSISEITKEILCTYVENKLDYETDHVLEKASLDNINKIKPTLNTCNYPSVKRLEYLK